jgi:hypothetical protein
VRLLVCGGRSYGFTASERAALFEAIAALKPTLIIHGDAPGADSVADKWAKVHGVPRERYPAQWRKPGGGVDYSAGPRRNALMLEAGKPDAVLAAPGGKGTANMVSLARAAGVRVYTFETIKDLT